MNREARNINLFSKYPFSPGHKYYRFHRSRLTVEPVDIHITNKYSVLSQKLNVIQKGILS